MTQPSAPIRIRPFRSDDFTTLSGWIPDNRFLVQWAGPGFSFPLTDEQFLEHTRQPHIHGYAALGGEAEHMVGYAEINRHEANVGRLCRVITGVNEHRGKGWGRELVSRMIEIGAAKFHYKRITLAVFDFNTSAISCYRALGFRTIAVRENAVEVEQESWTALEMALDL